MQLSTSSTSHDMSGVIISGSSIDGCCAMDIFRVAFFPGRTSRLISKVEMSMPDSSTTMKVVDCCVMNMPFESLESPPNCLVMKFGPGKQSIFILCSTAEAGSFLATASFFRL